MMFTYNYIKPVKVSLFAFITLFLFSEAHIPKTKPKGVKTIVIDAGHGGKDPGCNGDVFNEKTVALGIAIKLGELIEKNLPDVKVIYTRKTDEFVELEERAQIANRNNADLFISIHCNAASNYAVFKDKNGKVHYKTYKDKKGKIHKVEVHNPKPFGSATYVMGISNEKGKLNTAKRENASMLLEDNYQKTYNGFDPQSDEAYIVMSLWTGAFVGQSADIASKIQAEYTKKAGRVDKGVQRQSIWVLWRTAMPSILTEVGFLTNPEEEKFLGSEKGQKYMASALFRAVRSYKDENEGVAKKYDDELEKEEPLVNENLSKGNAIDTSNEDEKDSTQVANAANEEIYNGFLKEADDNYKLKKYEDALVKYEKCSELKPEERYPLARVEECKKKIAEQKTSLSAEEQQKKELKTKYNAFIASGDKLMTQKNWKAAAVQYQQASELLPDETYPKEKIKESDKNIEADKKLAEEKAKIKAEKNKADSLLKIQKQAADTVPPKAKDIVNNYKDKTPKKDTVQKVKTNNPPEGKSGIVFRVQFAMSETEPDIKSDKYKNADDIWYYKAGNVYKITSGSFSTADEVVKHQEKIRAAGYKDAFVVAFKNNQRIDFKEAVKQISNK
ncbi:MAG TPA: N-acetylmuramoyl-L-alanine amidase [Bacteroidia bacterium]|jgi:N-acetylmuramoyl-L-alanine amidase|nr:N-acetylmuramoyl-L-alanine amidase [Bacteroidia bacterium]